MTAFDHTFRAAIPGSSLTHQMGTLPHEKPPQFTDPNEALEYFWKMLHRPAILKQLWAVMEQGATVWAINRAILYKAALEGIIQLNLAVVIYKTLGQMIGAIGEAKGIKVTYVPKFRDSTKDQMLNQKLNATMGKRHGPQIPQSAIKLMQMPKAEDISKGHEAFMKMNIGKTEQETPMPPKGKGLLGLGKDQ